MSRKSTVGKLLWLALLLCVTTVLSAQASHLHSSSQESSHCQLCSAPHLSGVPPEASPVASPPPHVAEELVPQSDVRGHAPELTFCLGNRPPPVD